MCRSAVLAYQEGSDSWRPQPAYIALLMSHWFTIVSSRLLSGLDGPRQVGQSCKFMCHFSFLEQFLKLLARFNEPKHLVGDRWTQWGFEPCNCWSTYVGCFNYFVKIRHPKCSLLPQRYKILLRPARPVTGKWQMIWFNMELVNKCMVLYAIYLRINGSVLCISWSILQ